MTRFLRCRPEWRSLIATGRCGRGMGGPGSCTGRFRREGGRERGRAGRVLACRVEVRDGVVTDVLLDVPTDEGKVTALARAGVTAPDAVFGISVHDAAMLAIARRAFPVNPTTGLAERSAQEGWPVYYPV